MPLKIGNIFGKIFSNSPEDSQVLGFDGGTQRPGVVSSFFSGYSQTKTSGTEVLDTSVGTIDWNNMSNVRILDGNLADTDNIGVGGISKYLKATNFGFSIPPGAVITGIKVRINKGCSAGAANAIKDYSVKIVKNGAIGSTEKANAAYWPAWDTFNDVYYGSSTDLWGETWIADEINYDNFGVVISVTNDVGTEEALIDYISIQVYYSG